MKRKGGEIVDSLIVTISASSMTRQSSSGAGQATPSGRRHHHHRHSYRRHGVNSVKDSDGSEGGRGEEVLGSSSPIGHDILDAEEQLVQKLLETDDIDALLAQVEEQHLSHVGHSDPLFSSGFGTTSYRYSDDWRNLYYCPPQPSPIEPTSFTTSAEPYEEEERESLGDGRGSFHSSLSHPDHRDDRRFHGGGRLTGSTREPEQNLRMEERGATMASRLSTATRSSGGEAERYRDPGRQRRGETLMVKGVPPSSRVFSFTPTAAVHSTSCGSRQPPSVRTGDTGTEEEGSRKAGQTQPPLLRKSLSPLPFNPYDIPQTHDDLLRKGETVMAVSRRSPMQSALPPPRPPADRPLSSFTATSISPTTAAEWLRARREGHTSAGISSSVRSRAGGQPSREGYRDVERQLLPRTHPTLGSSSTTTLGSSFESLEDSTGQEKGKGGETRRERNPPTDPSRRTPHHTTAKTTPSQAHSSPSTTTSRKCQGNRAKPPAVSPREVSQPWPGPRRSHTKDSVRERGDHNAEEEHWSSSSSSFFTVSSSSTSSSHHRDDERNKNTSRRAERKHKREREKFKEQASRTSRRHAMGDTHHSSTTSLSPSLLHKKHEEDFSSHTKRTTSKETGQSWRTPPPLSSFSSLHSSSGASSSPTAYSEDSLTSSVVSRRDDAFGSFHENADASAGQEEERQHRRKRRYPTEKEDAPSLPPPSLSSKKKQEQKRRAERRAHGEKRSHRQAALHGRDGEESSSDEATSNTSAPLHPTRWIARTGKTGGRRHETQDTSAPRQETKRTPPISTSSSGLRSPSTSMNWMDETSLPKDQPATKQTEREEGEKRKEHRERRGPGHSHSHSHSTHTSGQSERHGKRSFPPAVPTSSSARSQGVRVQQSHGARGRAAGPTLEGVPRPSGASTEGGYSVSPRWTSPNASATAPATRRSHPQNEEYPSRHSHHTHHHRAPSRRHLSPSTASTGRAGNRISRKGARHGKKGSVSLEEEEEETLRAEDRRNKKKGARKNKKGAESGLRDGDRRSYRYSYGTCSSRSTSSTSSSSSSGSSSAGSSRSDAYSHSDSRSATVSTATTEEASFSEDEENDAEKQTNAGVSLSMNNFSLFSPSAEVIEGEALQPLAPASVLPVYHRRIYSESVYGGTLSSSNETPPGQHPKTTAGTNQRSRTVSNHDGRDTTVVHGKQENDPLMGRDSDFQPHDETFTFQIIEREQHRRTPGTVTMSADIFSGGGKTTKAVGGMTGDPTGVDPPPPPSPSVHPMNPREQEPNVVPSSPSDAPSMTNNKDPSKEETTQQDREGGERSLKGNSGVTMQKNTSEKKEGDGATTFFIPSFMANATETSSTSKGSASHMKREEEEGGYSETNRNLHRGQEGGEEKPSVCPLTDRKDMKEDDALQGNLSTRTGRSCRPLHREEKSGLGASSMRSKKKEEWYDKEASSSSSPWEEDSVEQNPSNKRPGETVEMRRSTRSPHSPTRSKKARPQAREELPLRAHHAPSSPSLEKSSSSSWSFHTLSDSGKSRSLDMEDEDDALPTAPHDGWGRLRRRRGEDREDHGEFVSSPKRQGGRRGIPVSGSPVPHRGRGPQGYGGMYKGSSGIGATDSDEEDHDYHTLQEYTSTHRPSPLGRTTRFMSSSSFPQRGYRYSMRSTEGRKWRQMISEKRRPSMKGRQGSRRLRVISYNGIGDSSDEEYVWDSLEEEDEKDDDEDKKCWRRSPEGKDTKKVEEGKKRDLRGSGDRHCMGSTSKSRREDTSKRENERRRWSLSENRNGVSNTAAEGRGAGKRFRYRTETEGWDVTPYPSGDEAYSSYHRHRRGSSSPRSSDSERRYRSNSIVGPHKEERRDQERTRVGKGDKEVDARYPSFPFSEHESPVRREEERKRKEEDDSHSSASSLLSSGERQRGQYGTKVVPLHSSFLGRRDSSHPDAGYFGFGKGNAQLASRSPSVLGSSCNSSQLSLKTFERRPSQLVVTRPHHPPYKPTPMLLSSGNMVQEPQRRKSLEKLLFHSNAIRTSATTSPPSRTGRRGPARTAPVGGSFDPTPPRVYSKGTLEPSLRSTRRSPYALGSSVSSSTSFTMSFIGNRRSSSAPAGRDINSPRSSRRSPSNSPVGLPSSHDISTPLAVSHFTTAHSSTTNPSVHPTSVVAPLPLSSTAPTLGASHKQPLPSPGAGIFLRPDAPRRAAALLYTKRVPTSPPVKKNEHGHGEPNAGISDPSPLPSSSMLSSAEPKRMPLTGSEGQAGTRERVTPFRPSIVGLGGKTVLLEREEPSKSMISTAAHPTNKSDCPRSPKSHNKDKHFSCSVGKKKKTQSHDDAMNRSCKRTATDTHLPLSSTSSSSSSPRHRKRGVGRPTAPIPVVFRKGVFYTSTLPTSKVTASAPLLWKPSQLGSSAPTARGGSPALESGQPAPPGPSFMKTAVNGVASESATGGGAEGGLRSTSEGVLAKDGARPSLMRPAEPTMILNPALPSAVTHHLDASQISPYPTITLMGTTGAHPLAAHNGNISVRYPNMNTNPSSRSVSAGYRGESPIPLYPPTSTTMGMGGPSYTTSPPVIRTNVLTWASGSSVTVLSRAERRRAASILKGTSPRPTIETPFSGRKGENKDGPMAQAIQAPDEIAIGATDVPRVLFSGFTSVSSRRVYPSPPATMARSHP